MESVKDEQKRATFWMSLRHLEWLRQQAAITGKSQAEILSEAIEQAMTNTEARALYSGWAVEIETALPCAEALEARLAPLLPGADISVRPATAGTGESIRVTRLDGRPHDLEVQQAVYRAIGVAQEAAIQSCHN